MNDEEIKKVKSVSEKLYNHVYKIVDDLVDKSCIHVGDMLITTETFKLFAEITYDEYKISMLGKTIAYALHLAFDIDESLMLTEVKEAIVNIFKFKHYYDPKSNEAFIQHLTIFVCRNLSFDTLMELEKKINNSSTTPTNWVFDKLHKAMDKIRGTRKMEQEETKTPKMELRYLHKVWSDKYETQPFIVESVDKDEMYFEKTENVDGTPSITRSHCIEMYIFNRLHKIFLTTFVWKKDYYDDEMVTSFLEFVRVRDIPVQLTLRRRSDGYANLHIESEDGKLWVDENCDDVMIESRNSVTLDTLCSGIEDEIRFTIIDGATRNTIECVSYMCTEISEEQKKHPVRTGCHSKGQFYLPTEKAETAD